MLALRKSARSPDEDSVDLCRELELEAATFAAAQHRAMQPECAHWAGKLQLSDISC